MKTIATWMGDFAFGNNMKTIVVVIVVSLLSTILLCLIGSVGYKFFRIDNLNQAALADDLVRCRELIQGGVNVNGSGMHAMTPLMSACKAGSLQVATYLVEHNADINGHNDSGSVLMWAIHSQNAKLVEYILSRRVNVSWKNSLGEDAMGHAKEVGNSEIIEMIGRR